MTKKHLIKAKILTSLLEGYLTTAEAASALGLSVRQVENLRPKFRREGIAGLIHGNSGRTPWNSTPLNKRQLVVTLLEMKYVGFTHAHATDMLETVEGITLSRHTLRRIAHASGMSTPKPQKRRSRHRSRRERREREGLLLQMDGSPHDWLEGRGPRLTLINGIDDATGRKWGRFREGEDLEGYVEVFLDVVRDRGIPEAIYTDRSGIMAYTAQNNRNTPVIAKATQFARMLEEVGVAVILAGSPQAKGRVERTHGTDQDRLVSLLRLANACTLEEANLVLEYHLEDFNSRFTVPPGDPKPAWRSAPSQPELDEIFCLKETRKVTNDNTVRIHGRVIDIPPGPGRRSYSGCMVTVHRRFDLTLGIFYQGVLIAGQPPAPRLRPKRRPRPDWLKPYQHRKNR